MIAFIGEVNRIVKQWQNAGKKVVLVTGCFDILHEGHILLFQYAKKYADYIVVGVDNDATIAASKGPHRPINPLNSRLKMVQAVKTVDAVFPIKDTFYYDDQKAADRIHKEILTTLMPDAICTSSHADSYWAIKKQRAEKLGVKFLKYPRPRVNSTSAIIEKCILTADAMD
jgi:cytidyltransferase-like protein